MTNSIGVGKEILSYCGRCKLSLAHIITVMKSTEVPLKVQCKTCQSVHAFRDAPTRRKSTGTRGAGRGQSKKEQVSWKEKVSQSSEEGRNYGIREKFVIGEIISHKTFGRGIVESMAGNNKINVLFESELKTLVHNKN